MFIIARIVTKTLSFPELDEDLTTDRTVLYYAGIGLALTRITDTLCAPTRSPVLTSLTTFSGLYFTREVRTLALKPPRLT